MNDLIVKTEQPIITANFDEVKQQLIAGLHQYDVIITADTVKDGKEMAAELNKIKKAIKEQEKQALDKIMGPANDFKAKVKELLDLAEEAREKITKQVKEYEDRTREEILDKIREITLNKIADAGLYSPFNTIETADLAKLTAVTKTGNLTKQTLSEIDRRIAEQKALQLEFELEEKRKEEARQKEIERIREEERIKAETRVQEMQQMPAQEYTEQASCVTNCEDTYQEPEANNYQETVNPVTGEVTQTVCSEEAQTGTRVKILVDFDVDISTVPNITDAQLVEALHRKLAKAGIHNASVRDIMRY